MVVEKVMNSYLTKSNLMHVQPRHLPRRTWPVRLVGRCWDAGVGPSKKNFFKARGSRKRFRVSSRRLKIKSAWKFLTPVFLTAPCVISNHRSCFVTEEGADVVSGFPGLGGCEADSENLEGMVAVGTVVEAVGGFDSAAGWCFEAEGVQVEDVANGECGSDGDGFTADWCSEAEGVQVEVVADGKGGGFDGNGFEAGWRFEAESVQNEDAIIGTCGLGGRDFAAGQEEMEVPGTMGSVHGKKVVPIRLTHPPYVICRRTISLLRPRLGVFHVSGRPLGSGVHLVGLGVGRPHVCRVRRVVLGVGCMEMGHCA